MNSHARSLAIRISLAVAVCALIPAAAMAQQRWERDYGGDDEDEGFFVRQTADSGYIVAGRTTSFENQYQVYLVKTDAYGDTAWTRNYGGTDDDGGMSVELTGDGGYIVAGAASTPGNSYQVYLVRANASGDTLWTRTYGGTGYDVGMSVQQTRDGGYIVTGYTESFGDSSQLYLVRTNAAGDTIWTKAYGGPGYEYGNSVRQTADGGYIITGYTTSFGAGSDDVWLVKTDSAGDTLWTRTYGGTGYDEGNCVEQTTDSGFVVAAQSCAPGGTYEFYLIKTNAAGDSLWSRTYGGPGSDYCQSVQQTTDGGYVVVGRSASFGNRLQVYLVRTDRSGAPIWTRTYGRAGNDEGISVRQTNDGGYVVAGRTTSFGNANQVYLVKTNADGSVAVELTPEAAARRTASAATIARGMLYLPAIGEGRMASSELLDISGRKVLALRAGANDISHLAPGVYFIKSADERRMAMIRVVVTR